MQAASATEQTLVIPDYDSVESAAETVAFEPSTPTGVDNDYSNLIPGIDLAHVAEGDIFRKSNVAEWGNLILKRAYRGKKIIGNIQFAYWPLDVGRPGVSPWATTPFSTLKELIPLLKQYSGEKVTEWNGEGGETLPALCLDYKLNSSRRIYLIVSLNEGISYLTDLLDQGNVQGCGWRGVVKRTIEANPTTNLAWWNTSYKFTHEKGTYDLLRDWATVMNGDGRYKGLKTTVRWRSRDEEEFTNAQSVLDWIDTINVSALSTVEGGQKGYAAAAKGMSMADMGLSMADMGLGEYGDKEASLLSGRGGGKRKRRKSKKSKKKKTKRRRKSKKSKRRRTRRK